MQSIPFEDTGVKGKVTYDTFSCNVFHENPETPDRVTPDVRFVLEGADGKTVTAPDGRQIKLYTFNGAYPGPVIRVRQGQTVHTRLDAKKNTHTIHHHGIEPTTFNDGVGHTSFEVSGDYDYQWAAAEAGTFFYHCHKNTTLHFEMGMFGFLIVDPPEGRGTLYSGGPRYDVEALWAADDMDPRWHELNHDAGLCGEDAGLNRFEPRYFLISGVFAPRTLTDSRTVIRAAAGQKILIRLLNASYSILRTTLGVDATVYGIDGRPLGEADRPWARPFRIPAGQAFELTSAQRWDLLLEPPGSGTYTARLEFRHWITRAIQAGGKGVVESRIIIA